MTKFTKFYKNLTTQCAKYLTPEKPVVPIYTISFNIQNFTFHRTSFFIYQKECTISSRIREKRLKIFIRLAQQTFKERFCQTGTQIQRLGSNLEAETAINGHCEDIHFGI
jgi:hypothetical protein